MNSIAFGIDLGTSTSAVSYIKNGRPITITDPHTKSNLVPSIVAMSRRGELLVGQDADDSRALPDQKIREAKRAMGSDQVLKMGIREMRPEEVAALVLKKIKENAEIALGEEMSRAVITVPAYFDDLPRKATLRAADLAGIEVIRLISEPVAAALAYGIDKLDDEAMLLVFDFGGGTLDVTILEMLSGVLDVKATDGDKELGGKDIDDLLIQFALQKSGATLENASPLGIDALKKQCEKAKKSLSTNASAEINVSNFGPSDSQIDIDIVISRAEFDALIQPLLDRALQKVSGSLKKANMSKDKINRLLLVGGSCYIPRVREAIESFFALKAEKDIEPDLAVTQGAAISAGLKIGAIDSATSVLVQDAATHRMGTSVITEVGNQKMLFFSELMPPNAPIPFVRTMRYSLTRLDQDQVEIDVLQDPSGNATFSSDAIPTSAIGVIKDIPPSTTGQARDVDVELRLDENQVITVTAKVIGIDRSVTLQLQSDVGRPNPLQALGAASVVDVLWEQSPLASRNSALIRRAEAVLSKGPGNAERIEVALIDLKKAVAENDRTGAQVARERLTDHLADLDD